MAYKKRNILEKREHINYNIVTTTINIKNMRLSTVPTLAKKSPIFLHIIS